MTVKALFDWRKLMWRGKATLLVDIGDKQFVYRISRHPSNSRIFYVYVRNEGSYYVGYVDKRGKYALLVLDSPASVGKVESVAVIEHIINAFSNEEELPDEWVIDHAGICVACGRTLTDSVSKELGIGPICRGKHE